MSANQTHCDWVQQNLDAELAAAHEIARVISVRKNQYLLAHGSLTVVAELSGNLLYSTDDGVDLPTTGDWVYCDLYDDAAHAIIHGLLPRKSLLKRKTAGKRVDFQLIAANLDVAFVVQSADENFNPRRLERYLVMIREGGISPLVLLSKCDLISSDEVNDLRLTVNAVAPGVPVIACSNTDDHCLEEIRDHLRPGLTGCLLGSSGVGKTTLLNRLVGESTFATAAVSAKHGKGRHTTTSRELVELASGAMIIDTPGMRELGNISVDAGLDSTFADIADLAVSCRFADCSHSNEKGCAVLAAVGAGSLPLARLQSYVKMKKESAFNEMSYAEKRKKDKDFGKMVNAAIKNKRR